MSSVRIYADPERLSSAAADLIAATLTNTVRQQGIAKVALSGGSTPSLLFSKLARPTSARKVPWNQTHFFWADERCVPPESEESNYGQAKRILFDQVPVPAENIHRVRGELDPQAAAEDYYSQLAIWSEVGKLWPIFDLVLLGLGEDGHTASIFPNLTDINDGTKPVLSIQAQYQNRPAWRVTLTLPVINSAKLIIFLVAGRAKAQIVARVLEENSHEGLLPAQRILPKQGTVIWLLDQAAAHLLKRIP